MNRWDEIQATARDIASNVHADPEKVTAMADDLIKLCGLMICAVGKVVAIDGESNTGDPDDESAYARYLTGERIQDAARYAVDEASSSGCDLERWSRVTPGTGCRCGHVPRVHQDGVCTGEQFNNEPCVGGPCTGFVVLEPKGVWTYQDRRPQGAQWAAIQAGCSDPFSTDNHRCIECRRIERFGHGLGCSQGPSRCNCCGGPCDHGAPVTDPARCCFPFGSICPIHC